MKKLLTVLICLGLVASLGLVACTTTGGGTAPVYPSACVPKADGTYDSVLITKLGANLKDVDIMFQLANLEALKHTDMWTKEQAEKLITVVENLVDTQGITFSTLVATVIPYVTDLNDAAGAEIYLMSQYLDMLNVPVPLSDCDKALLKAHLVKQRQIIILATGVKSTQGQPVTLKLPKKTKK